MVHEHFKISDTDGTVLDISDLLIIELRVDSVQTFDTKWNETITATQKQPDVDLMDNLHFSGSSGNLVTSNRCSPGVSRTRFKNLHPRVTPI